MEEARAYIVKRGITVDWEQIFGWVLRQAEVGLPAGGVSPLHWLVDKVMLRLVREGEMRIPKKVVRRSLIRTQESTVAASRLPRDPRVIRRRSVCSRQTERTRPRRTVMLLKRDSLTHLTL